MQRHEDVVLNQIGTPIPGVTVTVRDQNATPGSGALSTIYSDDGSTVISGSAVTTDTHGRFFFFAPDGKYDLSVTGTGITTYILADIEIADVTERFSSDTGWTVDTSIVGKLNNINVVEGSKFTTIQAANDNLSGPGIVYVPSDYAGAAPTTVDADVTIVDATQTAIGAGITRGAGIFLRGSTSWPETAGSGNHLVSISAGASPTTDDGNAAIPSGLVFIDTAGLDVAGLMIRHFTTGVLTAGLAVNSNNPGDSIFTQNVGTNDSGGTPTGILAWLGNTTTHSGTGDAIKAQHFATGNALTIQAGTGYLGPTTNQGLLFLDYGQADGDAFRMNNNVGGSTTGHDFTISDSAKTSGHIFNISHQTSTMSGNLLTVSLGGGAGSFTGKFLSLSANGGLKYQVDDNGNVLSAGTVAPQNTAAKLYSGSATPESAVTADVGSIFMRTDGGANTSIYVKESGSGNTGWVAK